MSLNACAGLSQRRSPTSFSTVDMLDSRASQLGKVSTRSSSPERCAKPERINDYRPQSPGMIANDASVQSPRVET
jgi:hypothetical protein